jgi:hypothetical protein
MLIELLQFVSSMGITGRKSTIDAGSGGCRSKLSKSQDGTHMILSFSNHPTLTVLGNKANLYLAYKGELEQMHCIRKIRGSIYSILTSLFLLAVIFTLPTILTIATNQTFLSTTSQTS